MLKKFLHQARNKSGVSHVKKDGKSEGDYVTLWDENPQEEKELFMFHPVHTPLSIKTVTDFDARPLLQDIFVEGQQVYQLPDLETHQSLCLIQIVWIHYGMSTNEI